MESHSPDINPLMEKGCEAMEAEAWTEAIVYFTEITQKMPAYAEGWNKRATAYYLRGDLKASIADINQTLTLEKRHFGALSGLLSIYLLLGDDRGALKTTDRLLQIRPAQPELQSLKEKLYQKLGIKKI
jgi:tetratricopeptide (TPR) repeat protein